MSTGGLVDGNFASLIHSNVNKIGDGSREFAIDLIHKESIICTFVANRAGLEEW